MRTSLSDGVFVFKTGCYHSKTGIESSSPTLSWGAGLSTEGVGSSEGEALPASVVPLSVQAENRVATATSARRKAAILAYAFM
jgi:hypothetical protein